MDTSNEIRPQEHTMTGNTRRAVAAATIGNLLESYDFAVYGYFAVTIAPLFFPADDPTASLLLTVATFGVGFFMRPVGAVVLGSLADRRGRKSVLTITILLMALGMIMIGLSPTYAQIGAAAPLILVAARLLQGFSAGGEVGTATAFLVEHAPLERRGFVASWQQWSQACALLLGSSVGVAVTGLLPAASLEAWGWRVPFLIGVLIGPVGLYLRARTTEPAEYAPAKSPLRTVLLRHPKALAAGIGITITWTVCTYFFLVYLPTYAATELGIGQSASLMTNSAGLLAMIVLVPIFGAMSDRVGRAPLLLGSALAIIIFVSPALALLAAWPSVTALLLFQVLFGILIAAFTGVAPAAIAEVCPSEVRSSGTSIAYNLAVACFGGLAPFIATWLIAATGSQLAPAWYVIGACALSIGAVVAFYRPPENEPRVARANWSGVTP